MDQYNHGLGTALRFISSRLKTEAEVRKKLETRYCPETIEQIIDKLKECSYIDDNNYISCYIRDRMKFNPMGRIRIKKELMAKGIAKSRIENNSEYNAIDEAAAIEGILTRKKIGYDKNDSGDKKRILDYFSRRGFDFNTVKAVMKQHGSDIHE